LPIGFERSKYVIEELTSDDWEPRTAAHQIDAYASTQESLAIELVALIRKQMGIDAEFFL